MLRHYLLVAFRDFRRAPAAVLIKLLVLSLGLTCFLLAYVVVSYWDHAEEGFAKADRTYVITSRLTTTNGFDSGMWPRTNALEAQYLKLDFPQFETVARLDNGAQVPVSANGHGERLHSAYADAEFLDVFDLPFIAGSTKTALGRPKSVVLTENAAIRLFGRTDIVGQTLRYDGLIDLTVTGVLGPIPQPSHLGNTAAAPIRFDMLVSSDVPAEIADILSPPAANRPSPPENWMGGYSSQTYVVLPRGSKTTLQSLEPQFDAFVKNRVPEDQRDHIELGMVPVRKVMTQWLDTTLFSGANIGISVTTLLFAFAGLVLGIACLNYANLATAEATRRAKEIGLRKAIGASRSQIAVQYLLETALLSLAALLVSIALTEILGPAIRAATGINVALSQHLHVSHRPHALAFRPQPHRHPSRRLGLRRLPVLEGGAGEACRRAAL